MNAFNIFTRLCERSAAIRRLVGALAMVLVGVGGAWAQPDSAWSRTYGGAQSDYINAMIRTSDGGYAMAGITFSFGVLASDFWCVRADSSGNSLWSGHFGRWIQQQTYDYCSSIIQTTDGGFALAGYSNRIDQALPPDFWLVRAGGNGDSLWSCIYGGDANEECTAVVQTEDGGFALAGCTATNNVEADFWLVRTDSNGDSLWSRSYRGDDVAYCRSILQMADGGFLLAGITFPKEYGTFKFYLVRTDSEGDSLWANSYGGAVLDWNSSIIQTADGGFAICGGTNTFGAGNTDFILLRIAANGDSLWANTYGGAENEVAESLVQTADGGFALGGSTQSFGSGGWDYWIVRTDSNGDSLWSKTFGGQGTDWCSAIVQADDGSFALGGGTESFGTGNSDFWLVKTGPDPLNVSDPNVHPSSFLLSAPFPNPFNARTTVNYTLSRAGRVRLGVYDPLGRLVGNIPSPGWETAGNHSLSWNAEGMAAGSYFLRLEAGGETRQKEMILLK